MEEHVAYFDTEMIIEKIDLVLNEIEETLEKKKAAGDKTAAASD